jgi:hypothetical protein
MEILPAHFISLAEIIPLLLHSPRITIRLSVTSWWESQRERDH